MKELLLGCGNRRVKDFRQESDSETFENLVTLDIDPSCEPDIVHDLNILPWPFDHNEFDQVHAYEVLEHLGKQGDYKSFFAHFSEIHRILKPGGKLYATVPMWDCEWAWGDPGHTRIITKNTLIFLSQEGYKQVGKTQMTDYRSIYKANFLIYEPQEREQEGVMRFVLEAAK